MRGPLAVVLDDGSGMPRPVTRHTSGLTFTKAAMGGDHSGACSIDVPLVDFPNLGPADRVHIDDASTGRRLFTGYTENPGRRTRGGQGFDLALTGGMALARDESRPLLYIDRQTDSWKRDPVATMPASAGVDPGEHPTKAVPDPGWVVQFNPGLTVGSGWFAQVANHTLERAGMEFGGLHFGVSGGKDDGNWEVRVAWSGPATGSTEGAMLQTMRYTIAVPVGDVVPAGSNRVALVLSRVGGATNVADDLTWAFYDSLVLTARRMDRHGSLLNAEQMGGAYHVTASAVVEDLLGRMLGNVVDIPTAIVESALTPIDQMVYLAGTTAGGIFDDLSLWEPGMLWQIGAMMPSGKHSFAYRAWPTTPRYEVTSADDYTAPGGEIDLCNRIAVYWTDAAGTDQSTIVTAAVPELGSRVKDAPPLTLPAGRASAANAQRIGEQTLAALARPSNAGSAVIRRPIYDHLWGRLAMPWEIEPGHLVHIRETGEDLRLSEMTYSDESCSTKVTLGEPRLSQEQRIARLQVTA